MPTNQLLGIGQYWSTVVERMCIVCSNCCPSWNIFCRYYHKRAEQNCKSLCLLTQVYMKWKWLVWSATLTSCAFLLKRESSDVHTCRKFLVNLFVY